jgi:acyl-CoA synthetase (AMP-forming)/AMP-acid ligase II
VIRTELIASVPELLRRQADAYGDKIAFADRAGAVTYSQLYERTGNLGGFLRHFGIAPGDAVAILLPNSIEWIEACFAILRAGAVSVPISYESTIPEISYRLLDANCRLLVTTDEMADKIIDRIRLEVRNLQTVLFVDRGGRRAEGLRFGDLVHNHPPVAAPDPAGIDQPSFIVYTSGTTGRAKGVLLSVRGMLWVTAACWVPIAGLSERDHVLSPLPLFHSYALNLSVLSILATGASEYILEKYSTNEVLRLLQTGPYTLMPGVPTMFHYLLQAAGDSLVRFPNMRLFISAGAIMPASLNKNFENAIQVPLLDGYGITETSTMVTMNWPTGTRVIGSCGLPVPGLTVRLVDSTGCDVGPGAEGELIVRGPNVMLGYHNKPEETASAIRDGWYQTGDLAKCDTNGYLTITGRVKELIIRGGQNIGPAEIEEAASTFEGILDCAVVGAEHEELGEVPVLFIVEKPGYQVEVPALLDHCRERLSAYKLPHAVRRVEEIPRTGSGKIIRYRLREQLKAAQ